MSQYIAVEVSDAMTWTFNVFTIINDLLFAYILHKMSKRVPIPFQWDNEYNDNRMIPQHIECKTDKNAVPLKPLNEEEKKEELIMNLHENKCINKCYICNYRLTEPTYPSYYFDDITADQRKELLENHWRTLQDQTPSSREREREKSVSIAPSHGGKGIFAITAKRMTGLVFKKRSIFQYASLSLRLWSVALGIIALALSWSFWMNMLLEYCIACIFNRGNTASILGLLAVFAIVHCAMFWLKRQWQSLKLLWFNICDHLSISYGILWRLINLLLCLSFTLWSSLDSKLNISDSVFWQLFLRWMVLQGLIWEIGYVFISFLINIWVVYRLYLTKYDFKFIRNLGKSHLKSIRKTINNMTNVFTEENIQKIDNKPIPSTILEDKEEEEKEEKEMQFERQLSDEEIDDLSKLHEIEITQQNILQSMQSRSMNKNRLDTFLMFFCAFKDDEDRNAMICYQRIKKIYIKYFYILGVIIAIITCFSVSDDGERAMCNFAAWIFLMYYLIVLFRRAKYNAIYCFWSSKYHARFYNNLQIIHSFKTQKRAQSKSVVSSEYGVQIEHKSDRESIGGLSVGLLSSDLNQMSFDQENGENQSIHDDDDGDDDKKEKQDERDRYIAMDEFGQNAKEYSDIEHEEIIIYHDLNRNIFVKTKNMDYMDFWSMIELDDNDFYGCNVFCGATKELCGLICAIILIIIFVALAITFSTNTHSPTTSVYAQNKADQIIAPYPMCEVEWGRNYMNLLDMIYLTVVAYYSDRSEIKNMFTLWFGNTTNGLNGSGWEFDKIHIESQKPAFFHIPNENGLEVVALRGTYDMDDVLQDVSLYTEIATLQTFSWIIPLTTVLPVGFIRDFIKYASIPEGMIDPTLRDRYDEPIYSYVADKLGSSLSKDKEKGISNKTIFIMGHSLGGGVAEIVAAKFVDEGYTNIYSFGLSSPGTLWSSLKFDFSVEALDKSSISVLPRRDPVSSVDKHGGVTQIIECDAEEMLFCHLSTRSFCEIYQECGTHLVRNLSFTKCVCGNQTNPAKDWSECW